MGEGLMLCIPCDLHYCMCLWG